MPKNKSIIQEIEDLKEQLKAINLNLDTQIAKIDEQLNSIELEFMYGNITENLYDERMQLLGEDIAKVRNRLKKIQDLEDDVL
jgi:DNA repair exonuclease SbcCD ATPase subunit